MTDIVNFKRKELLNLPHKKDINLKEYESIIIVPTKYKHDSGWRLMALIGVEKIDKKFIPTEIIGYCDDIHLILPIKCHTYEPIRYDMLLSNCIRMWSYNYVFKVGMALSSTDIYVIHNKTYNEI